ncbi:MAG TPA: AAA family ATPase, partial [Streptosporangiaceae bacterium]
QAASSTERALQEIRSDLGRKMKRVVLPQGINDVAEFFQQYDWNAFRVLLKNAVKPVRHYPRLDLTKPVPDTDWLVQDLLVSREVTVLAADSGVGKSWLAMQLALAVADEEPTFLGLALKKHGRVLYVDEENPAELVMQRLRALGITPEQRENLDYLWYAGVDLANEPEKLYEEAIDSEPQLIVLDSLSRIALGVEENDNTAMSKLFRSSLVPLARDTGAAVVVLHHTPSDNAGKPRGATAIKAAADQVISMVAAQGAHGHLTGSINIFPSKPRRQLTHLTVRIEGDMERDGWVRVKEITEDIPM